MTLAGIGADREEVGGALPGPEEIAGGGVSVKVEDARGFEFDLVGPRT